MSKNRKSLLALMNNEYIQDDSRIAKILRPIVGLFGKDIILKESRQKIPQYVANEPAQIREPRYDPESLWETWKHSWVLGAIERAISQEITRNGYDVVPRFKSKCKKCGKEYQETTEKCDCGSKRLSEPDMSQWQEAKRLITEPNPDYSFVQMLNSIIEYELALSNWYLEVGFKRSRKLGLKSPKELYILDSRYIRPVANDFGHLGDNHYFCPSCYQKQIEAFNNGIIQHADIDEYIDVKQAFLHDFHCEKCGSKLLQTCYVEIVNGEVQSRWDADEIIHGSKERVLPKLFGVSKLVELYKVVETLRHMDDYNWEVYSVGKVGKIVYLPEYDEHDIAVLQSRIEQELQKIAKRDIQSGQLRLSKKIRTQFVGGKRGAVPMEVHDIMSSLDQMQSREFYDLYVFASASIYGCQPIFMTFSERGRTGTTPILQIRVQDRTTKDYQGYIESVFNEKVFPIFGVTDWIFKFNKIEERDKLREAQIMNYKAATALTLVNAGFNVGFDENQELEITGKGKRQEPTMRQEGRMTEPRRAEDGSAAPGIASVRPDAETRESTRTGELVQRALRLPISWYELTKFEAFGKTYAVNNDQNEVYLTIDGVELPETRGDARNFHYAIAGLIDMILNDARSYIRVEQTDFFDVMKQTWIINLRREYNGAVLSLISSFFDSTQLGELAKKFDNLRDRLDKILLSSLEEGHV